MAIYYVAFALAFLLWFLLRMREGVHVWAVVILTVAWPVVLLIVLTSFAVKTTRGKERYVGRHEAPKHTPDSED